MSSVFYDDNQLLAAPVEQFASFPFGCHGPGAVEDGARGRDKWYFNHFAGISDRIYQSSRGYLTQSGLEGLPFSKLAVVPKDFRGHRLICVEPKEFMFYQQGLMRVITQLVHNHWLTGRCIDFNNQVKSQRLSRNPRYATIDLKDASDLISLRLARTLLPREIFRLITVARSQGIQTPDGDVVAPYHTFLTMGNALCFPMQTLLFWSLSLATMISDDHLEHIVSTPSKLLSFIYKNKIRVFGDDIIVPKRNFESVCTTLSRCGLAVNAAKSCCNTPVRESCGSWYYHGIDCRIVRLKAHKAGKESEWISLFDAARQLYMSGFSKASEAILTHLDVFLPVPRGFGWVPGPRNPGASNYRYNSNYQRVEVRIPVLVGERPDVLTGEVGLYSYFTGKGSRAAPHCDLTQVEWGWVAHV